VCSLCELCVPCCSVPGALRCCVLRALCVRCVLRAAVRCALRAAVCTMLKCDVCCGEVRAPCCSVHHAEVCSAVLLGRCQPTDQRHCCSASLLPCCGFSAAISRAVTLVSCRCDVMRCRCLAAYRIRTRLACWVAILFSLAFGGASRISRVGRARSQAPTDCSECTTATSTTYSNTYRHICGTGVCTPGNDLP
jgi:hypothetical protein